jgi:hypothetical protein
VTDCEREVLDLAIKWRDSKYAVEEAIIRQKFIHATDMLKKERRDKRCQKLEKNTASEG